MKTMKAKMVKEYLNEADVTPQSNTATPATPAPAATPAAPAQKPAPKIPLPDQAKWDALIGHLVEINKLLKQAPAPAQPTQPVQQPK